MAEREAATAVTRRSQVLFAVPAPPHRQISLSPSRGSRRFEQRGPRHGCSPAAPHGALRGRAGREGAGAVPPSPQGRGCASGRRLSGCGGAPARPAGRFASPGRGGQAKGAAAVVLPEGRGALPASVPLRPLPAAGAALGVCEQLGALHHGTVWGLLAEKFVSCNAPGGGNSLCFPRREPSKQVFYLSGVPQGCWKPSAQGPPQGGWTIVGGLCAYTSVCLLHLC